MTILSVLDGLDVAGGGSTATEVVGKDAGAGADAGGGGDGEGEGGEGAFGRGGGV